MNSLFIDLHADPRRYRTLGVSGSDSSTGPRVGGVKPQDVRPRMPHELTRYFGTFPVTQDQSIEVSIFTAFVYTFEHELRLDDNVDRVLTPADWSIQCEFHPPSQRATNHNFVAEFAGRAVEIGPETLPGGAPQKGHTLGGVPKFEPHKRNVISASERLLAEGFVHFMQWFFPGPRDDVRGGWPFGDNTFHLYIKEVSGEFTFRSIISGA